MSQKLEPKKCLHCKKKIPFPTSQQGIMNWPRRMYCEEACRHAANRNKDNSDRNERRRKQRAEAKDAKLVDARKRMKAMDKRMKVGGKKLRTAWHAAAEMHPDFAEMLINGLKGMGDYDPVFMMDRSINK